MTLLIASDYKRGNSYKVRVCIRITRSNQSRALPLISRQSPRLVRPSVFLARSARLARYAVAQRVQNSRVWPHNGLKSRGYTELAGAGLRIRATHESVRRFRA